MKSKLKILLIFLLPFGFLLGGGFLIWKIIKRKRRRMEQQTKTKDLGWKYFTLTELDTRKNKDVEISPEIMANLDQLVKKVLDPLREIYGHPIHVNSGLRDYVPTGGSTTSDHERGCAVDIEGFDRSEVENRRLAQIVKDSGLPYTQLINEWGFSWLHVANNPADKRKRLTLSSGERKNPKYKQVGSDWSKFLV